MTKALAIIPARGGSKRIPRKNIKEFCGKPIIAYSIEAALESKIFDTVMVSTDDNEIAKIAKEYGADFPFYRSKEASSDYATTADVIEEVLSVYADQDEHFDLVCCLYATAPFVTAGRIEQGFNIINDDQNCSLVVPVVKYSYPPQRAYLIKDDVLVRQYPEYVNARSQDLEPIYHDVGQFYFYRIQDDAIVSAKKISPLIISELESQDIDDESDWCIAEYKYKSFNKK